MNGQRPRPPYIYRLIRDASGQSETFGVILLLAITVVGTTAIVAFGSQALNQTQSAATLQRTEHTMTLLDSRAAMVALGESEMQTVQFGSSQQGSFHVNEDAGWIKVIHRNFSGKEAGKEIIYNKTLGVFYYENGDTTIAYQAGGVWRIDGDGEARMISQPEVHYRSATLTMPIIRIRGEGSAAGATTVTVESLEEARRIYPNTTLDHPWGNQPASEKGMNETGAPYNNSSTGDGCSPSCESRNLDAKRYTNPIKNGNVTILIHSQFYEGWAHYFKTRTTAKVTVHDSNKTIHVKLRTIGDPNFFGTLANSIKIRGMSTETHSLNNYTVNMTEGRNGDGSFKSMHWSFYASEGNQKFELHITPNGNPCDEIRDGDKPLLVTIYYENGSGGHGDQSQEWRTNVYNVAGSDFIKEVHCEPDPEYVVVNWDAEETLITYNQITNQSCGNSKWHYADDYSKCDGNGPGTATFTAHPNDTTAPAPSYPLSAPTTDAANISFVVAHYMAKLAPSFTINGDEGPGNSNRVLEDESSGNISFDQSGGQFITYLHISENEIKVELD